MPAIANAFRPQSRITISRGVPTNADIMILSKTVGATDFVQSSWNFQADARSMGCSGVLHTSRRTIPSVILTVDGVRGFIEPTCY